MGRKRGVDKLDQTDQTSGGVSIALSKCLTFIPLPLLFTIRGANFRSIGEFQTPDTLLEGYTLSRLAVMSAGTETASSLPTRAF